MRRKLLKTVPIRILRSAAFLAGLLPTLPVYAQTGPCTNLPRQGWVSVGEVESRLQASGFRLLRLRISNKACYTALVSDAEGRRLELLLHPASSAILATAPLPPASKRER